MTTIVTRAGKGSSLTWTEGDANITNLNNDKLEDITGESIGDLSDVTVSAPTTGQVLTYTMSGQWENQNAPSGGIASVSADTNPALGGNLDLADYEITNTLGNISIVTAEGSSNIYLDTDTGFVYLNELKFPNTDGTSDQVLKTDGAGNLSFTTVTSGITDVVSDTTPQLGGNLDVNGNSIVSTSNGNIVLEPNGTGDVYLNADTIRVGDSGSPTYITSQFGPIGLSTVNGTNSGFITITNGSNGNISITPNGTGGTVITNLEYQEFVHALGTTSGTIAPNAANGNVQTITLNGNLTINGFTSPVSGQTITLIINTGGTGRTLTSSMLFAGGSKTLSTTNTVDILTMSYIGTTYYASLVKGYA
jgi:hypothetical protein